MTAVRGLRKSGNRYDEVLELITRVEKIWEARGSQGAEGHEKAQRIDPHAAPPPRPISDVAAEVALGRCAPSGPRS